MVRPLVAQNPSWLLIPDSYLMNYKGKRKIFPLPFVVLP